MAPVKAHAPPADIMQMSQEQQLGIAEDDRDIKGQTPIEKAMELVTQANDPDRYVAVADIRHALSVLREKSASQKDIEAAETTLRRVLCELNCRLLYSC